MLSKLSFVQTPDRQQSSAELEFIGGAGVILLVVLVWWEGRSLVVLGVRGQLLALNSCPKSSRDKD